MNKKALLPLLIFAAFALKLSAQFDPLREQERMMSFGRRPCFLMEFSGTDAGVVEDVWKKFAKENFNAKLKKSKGEWTATKLRSSVMGDEVFTLYSTIETDGVKTSLAVWVDAGSYFLNRHDNRRSTEDMLGLLRQCYYDIRRAAIGKELKTQQTYLSTLESNQKKLSKTNDDLRLSIASWEAKIQKAKLDISNNELSQETNLVEQEKQLRLLEETQRRLENVENEGGN